MTEGFNRMTKAPAPSGIGASFQADSLTGTGSRRTVRRTGRPSEEADVRVRPDAVGWARGRIKGIR